MALEHLVSTKEYVPAIYKDVKEMDALCISEDYLFDMLVGVLAKEYNRMFIQTSDEIGVARFEAIYKIVANPQTESLDFRKARLLLRSNTVPPYSTIWLRNYLNSVIGENNYDLKIDYKNLTMTLYGFLTDYNWVNEVVRTIQSAKPLQMIFINIPTIIDNLCFERWVDKNTWDSDIWNDENFWNEFKVLDNEQIKHCKPSTDVVSIDILKNDIVTINLNNDTTIYDFEKRVVENTIYLNFVVPNNLKLLTAIQLLGKDGKQILLKNCYIPSDQTTEIEIRLNCYEKVL